MPSPNATPTPITPPRVPLIDPRTGLIDRAWYLFFLSLLNVATTAVDNPDIGPSQESLIATYDAALQALAQNVDTQPAPVDLSAELTKQIEAAGLIDCCSALVSQVAEMQKQIEALSLLPLPSQGTVTAVTATTPVVSSGGTTPDISMPAASTSVSGYLTSTDWNTFNGKAPATSGTSILYGNGSGGFSNVTIGSGVSFAGGTLSATGSGGTVTSVTGTSPVVSSGGSTPAISLATAYGDTLNPYASKTANYVLAAPNGSAGAPTFRALVAADVPGSALTKTDDTNVTLTLGGSPTTALLNAASLTLGWTGQLGISRGGTNTSTAPSAYGVVYGNSGGTAYTSLANGTTGQVLTATTSGAPSWASPAYTGTVTSVSFTGGIISVATATTTPALTVAGTSGGIPYFSSGTTWATSAALAANAIVLGGGAGAAPATTTTGTGVVTALGVNTGTAGAFVVNGGALGTPSSGTVTNLTGTASININGTVGATTANVGTFTTINGTGAVIGSSGISSAGNLLVGTTTDFTSTTVSGGVDVAGYGIYPYVSAGTTNTAGSTGINWYTPTAFSGNNGTSTQNIFGISSIVNVKNTGSGGVGQVNGYGMQSTASVESSGVNARVGARGLTIVSSRYSATDLSTRTDNAVFGIQINAQHAITAPNTIVSSNLQAVAGTVGNNSGTVALHVGTGSVLQVGTTSGAPTTVSTLAYSFLGQTYTVGQASGNTATVTTGASFYAAGPTVAATGTMTTFYGLYLGSATVTGTLTNNWGVYSSDTAATNYFGGTVGIGTTSPAATAILDVQSTTKGVRFPNMTTAQKTAITPGAGTVVFDTTLSKLCVYSGAAWQTITSI